MFQCDVSIDDIAPVVGGDKPAGYKSTGEVSSLARIKRLAQKMHVMAVLDPYRSSLTQELEYMNQKREAGAKGFFTQLFFSLAHVRYWD